ncbi:MAG: VWA domain-containing protein [Planctomycetes bacterium]|nr:VWA domain-containing protein [Planctomycetota bacterium]MCB9884380.1 VWA domain-containing protein [Planctomycetota bacterium]
MNELLRKLAEWRGITIEPGAEVQFELAGFPTGGLGLLVLLGCLLVLLLVAFVYRRDGSRLTTLQRVILASLRAIAVLAAVALLLEPNLVAVERQTRPGHTILLLDTSQSMTHLDAFRREQVQPLVAGWREMGVTDPAAKTRLDLAKSLLAHRDGELVGKLAAKNEAQLYGFSSSITPLPLIPPPPPPQDPAAEPRPEPAPRLDLANIEAEGRSTNLGSALRAALDRSRAAEIAGVVILSDGRRNAGPQGAEIARLLTQRKVPHTLVLGIGDPSETQAVLMARLDAPEKVFQKDPFQMQTTVSSQGYDPQQIQAKLVRIDENGAETTVATQPVAIREGRADVVVDWKQLTVDEPGRFLFRAELTPPDGEPFVAERHSKTAAVEVLGERTRVLLLSGSGAHEFQILRNLLIRDKTIDVTCWQQSADPKFPQDGNEGVRIEELPTTREQFDPYDVVILIDPDPAQLSASFCNLLQQHVVEGGGGLWWVSGEKHSLDAVRATAVTRPIADLLPVEPDIEFIDREFAGLGHAFPRPWPLELSADGDDGIAAKISRITDGKDESRILWSRLPGMHYWFQVRRAKPVATVIAESTNPELKRGGKGMPMIAVQNVGAGRVLYNGSDETYRWRSTYPEAYERFWVKGIRYLFEGRIHAGNTRLLLTVDTDKVDLGDAVLLTAAVKTESLQPLIAEGFEVTVEREGQPAENMVLQPVEGVPGTYELRWRPTQLGSYRIRPAQKLGRPVETAVQVVPAQIERQGPMERAELAAIAAVPGGELFQTPAELLAALDRLPARTVVDTFRTPHSLWDGWVTVAFIVLVLSIEWLLRKRFNLL